MQGKLLSEALLWSGIFIETLILVRSFQGGFFSKYRFFYVYIAVVLASSIADFIVSTFLPSYMGRFYWNYQIITLVMGCGVLLEIIRHVLSPHPGPERFGIWVLIIGVI